MVNADDNPPMPQFRRGYTSSDSSDAVSFPSDWYRRIIREASAGDIRYYGSAPYGIAGTKTDSSPNLTSPFVSFDPFVPSFPIGLCGPETNYQIVSISRENVFLFFFFYLQAEYHWWTCLLVSSRCEGTYLLVGIRLRGYGYIIHDARLHLLANKYQIGHAT